ncbi:COR domain-containing protein [Tenacibaculum sp. MEBiC06402]|uniref:COR domain-containing protein n=1 Tax=unclassified Tenacibaculum TaxID=2635139 RepID=UPI003B9DAA11
MIRNEEKINKAINNVVKHGWGIIDLRNCGLKEIPRELYNYPNLVSIDISNTPYADESEKNQITEIPDDISRIKRLTRLNLENNKIERVSEKIATLTRLKHLNLNNNKLEELSEKIANMSGLEELKISNNPFEMLPPEIIARGIDSVRNFFKELKEQDYIYEVKLLIVGEGRVGKTCLSQALVNDEYELNHEESTEGIKINRWIIPKSEIETINPRINRDFQINIWDFGGQEIYHSTHQFFLTKRSIYLLVTESRKEDSHDDFFYWLNIIKLLGDKSPVMMLLNKADQPNKELPINEYKAAFNNIINFNKISLKREHRDNFLKFKDLLKETASKLPHIGNPLPKVWVEIRKDLEELKLSGKNYISQSEYFEICKNHYRKEDSALLLSEYFHDLGVIIHFQKDIELKDIVILNHEWITKGVYKILDDKRVIEQNGRFNYEDIERIWTNDDFNLKTRELISLMKNTKFDLCFELKNGEFLVPRLLPVDEIDHNWEPSNHNSKFEFRYKFMPKGIVARLIVKMNSDIYENKYWRYGVILNYEDTFALIKEKYFENKITIELNGKNKREFLFLIRKTLNEIHRDFNKLDVAEMIPCNCSLCKESEKPHFYEFNLLKRYESKELFDIRCDISLENVNVLELTSDISRKAINDEKIIICENQNAELLTSVGFSKTKFFPENNSNGVFIKIKTNPDYFGLRDRDFLIDSEIDKIQKKYPNYYILNYYCIENYLFHPRNINELKLEGFDIKEYTDEIIRQKNEVKYEIISNFKKSRDSYQEFKITSERIRNRSERSVIDDLGSDELEVFFKYYSMKDKFNKDSIQKYQLKQSELANTKWFKDTIGKIIES